MNDLVRIVKENLPYNVILTGEPYRVKLSDNLLYAHGSFGYVFHTKNLLSDREYHEEVLFISDSRNNDFHNVVSLFGCRVEELSERCYWVDENDIIMEALKI